MRVRLSLVLLAAAALAGAQTVAPPAPVTLHVGDPAPKLTIVKWLKGAPADLADGKVHVVEFWATWCGPCKVGMPHLSDLAAKYRGKAEFVSVDASEHADDVALAETFVKQSGPMMAYGVAYATPKGAMSQDWMKAAGQNGIPCAFVVDKGGKIGWIGHPMLGLDEAVGLAVQGKLDANAAAAIDKAWEAKMAKGQEDFKAMAQAQKDDNTDEALRLNGLLRDELPYLDPLLVSTRYALLAKKDPASARAYGANILKERANAPLVLQSLAAAIARDGKEKADFELAQSLVDASLNCAAADFNSHGLLAKIAFGAGDKAAAIRHQQDALKAVPEGVAYDRARAAAAKALAEYQAR